MRRGYLLAGAVAVALLPILLGLVTNLVAAEIPKDWQTRLAWPAFWLLTLVVVGVEARRRLAGQGNTPSVPAAGGPVSGGGDERLAAAAAALGAAVRRQWSDEAGVRGFRRPRPLRLPWSTTDRPVLPPVVDILGEGVVGGRPQRLRLRGGVTEFVDTFLALPRRQIVVLGEPGAGKTALAVLVTLGLLDKRADDTTVPVPVLLSLSSWRADKETLYGWVARRLSEDYPALANTELYGPDAPASLIAEGYVFPVLDGMDELPEGLHVATIESINLAVGASNPLILTCRSAEYQAAVVSGRVVPATAMVVELRPVERPDTFAFLSAGRVDGDSHWMPVFTRVVEEPDGALAQALRTPLMVGLVRAAYGHPGAHPEKLLDFGRFADRASIERHLLDTFVTAAYAEPPPSTTPIQRRHQRHQRQSRYSAEQAGRWLAFLAHHMQRQRTYDLAWWEVHRALPRSGARRVVGLSMGGAVAAIAAVAVWLAVAPTVVGSAGALLLGLGAGLVAGLVTGPYAGIAGEASSVPSQINPKIRDRLRELVTKLGSGLGTGLVFGLVVGLVAELSYTLVFGLTDPVRLGLLLGLLFGMVAGIAFGLSGWLNMPADSIRAPNPAAILRADRIAKLVQLLVFGLAFGLTAGVATGLTAGLAIGLVDGLGVGLIGVVIGLARGPDSWSRFLLIRSWLALRGRLPWRLMAFLDDAHQRGVLRQTGGVYQFRHALLQDRLAGADVPGPASPPIGAVPPTMPIPIPRGGPGTGPARVAAARVVMPQVPLRRQVLMLAVVALVAGAGLGVGLPVAGGLQIHCGVSPFDGSIRFLRSGLDSDCIGMTDGSYDFDPDLAEVDDLISRENERVRLAFQDENIPYVRVALLAPLTSKPGSILLRSEIMHAVQGAYIAQQQANRTSRSGTAPRPNIELLLANVGSGGDYWGAIVRQLTDQATGDHPLAVVVGLGISNTATANGARALSRHGIPMIGAILTADNLGHSNIPHLVSVSPRNMDHVEALKRYLSTRGDLDDAVLVSDSDTGNLYSATLQEDFSRILGSYLRYPFLMFTGSRYFDSSEGGVAAEFSRIVNDICTEAPDMVFYAGSKQDIDFLMRSLLDRPCIDIPMTIVTSGIELTSLQQYERDLAAKKITVIYSSSVDPRRWATGGTGTPEHYTEFESTYRESFPQESLGDSYAIMHHDAVTTAVWAIHLAASTLQRVPSAAEVSSTLLDLHGEHSVPAASGTLSFDQERAGNPGGKPIPIIEIPASTSPDLPETYITPTS